MEQLSNWQIIAGVALVAYVGFLVWIVCRLIRRPSVRLSAYRKVITRERAVDSQGGEIVVLECGHRFRLIHHHRESFHCGSCAKGER